MQSRYYRAPEVILELQLSEAIDMWSVGCIMLELYLGIPVFPGSSNFDMLSKMISFLG
jgi:dual specificity protein kinase YAK1